MPPGMQNRINEFRACTDLGRNAYRLYFSQILFSNRELGSRAQPAEPDSGHFTSMS